VLAEMVEMAEMVEEYAAQFLLMEATLRSSGTIVGSKIQVRVAIIKGDK